MPGRPPDANPDDRIAYKYEPAESEWRAWTNTVPRETPLYRRLDTLLEYDREHDLDALVADDGDDGDTQPDSPRAISEGADAETVADALAQLEHRADADAVAVSMVRIRRRCMTALPNAREHGADTAAEEVSEIQDLATDVLEGRS